MSGLVSFVLSLLRKFTILIMDLYTHVFPFHAHTQLYTLSQNSLLQEYSKKHIFPQKHYSIQTLTHTGTPSVSQSNETSSPSATKPCPCSPTFNGYSPWARPSSPSWLARPRCAPSTRGRTSWHPTRPS